MPWGWVAAATVVSGLIGSDASSNAADTQASATRDAAATNAASSDAAIEEQRRQYDLTRSDTLAAQALARGDSQAVLADARARADAASGEARTNLGASSADARAGLQPFIGAGVDATQALAQMLHGDKPFFSLADLSQDPIVQAIKSYATERGENAITNAASARGEGDSGNTLRAITELAGNIANSTGADAYGRKISLAQLLSGASGQGQNAEAILQQILSGNATNLSSIVSGGASSTNNALVGGTNTMAGQGVQGAISLGSLSGASSQAISQLLAATGQYSGNAIMGAGNAQAAGSVGAANAWSSSINSGIQSYQTQQLLQRFLPSNTGTSLGNGLQTSAPPSYGAPSSLQNGGGAGGFWGGSPSLIPVQSWMAGQ